MLFCVEFDREHLVGLVRQSRHRQRAESLPAGLRPDLDARRRRAALVRGQYVGKGLTLVVRCVGTRTPRSRCLIGRQATG